MPRSKTSKPASKRPAKRRPPPTREPRTYSDDFKLMVLAGLKANGHNLTATSRQFNVPRATIIEWIQKAVAAAQTSGRAGSDPLPPLNPDFAKSLAQTLEDYAKTIASIDPRMLHVYKITVRDVGVALGIIAERVLLLRGEPTKREAYDLTMKAGLTVQARHLRPDQASVIGRVVDELCNDGLIVYNPRPGEPGYDPGIDVPNAYPTDPRNPAARLEEPQSQDSRP